MPATTPNITKQLAAGSSLSHFFWVKDTENFLLGDFFFFLLQACIKNKKWENRIKVDQLQISSPLKNILKKKL